MGLRLEVLDMLMWLEVLGMLTCMNEVMSIGLGYLGLRLISELALQWFYHN